MSEVVDLKERLGAVSGSGSWNIAPWVIVVLVLMAVAGIGFMYYRDWQLQKAWRRRPKPPDAAKPGGRIPGLTLAEVRRAKQSARQAAHKGDTGLIPT